MKSNPADSEKKWLSLLSCTDCVVFLPAGSVWCGGSSYKPGEEGKKGLGGTSLNALRFEMKFEGDFPGRRYHNRIDTRAGRGEEIGIWPFKE